MPDFSHIWTDLPDAWLRLDGASRQAVEGLWEGMDTLVRQLIVDLNRVNIDSMAEYALPDRVALWEPLEVTERTTTLPPSLLAVPKLQDRITHPRATYVEGTDYSVASGELTWIGNIPGIRLWAPQVRYANTHSANLFADLLPLEDWRWNDDTRRSLALLRCLWFCFLHGPTVENIRYAITAMAALPSASHPGQVEFVGESSVRVRYDDTCYGYSDAEGRVLCGRPVVVNKGGVLTTDRRFVYTSEADLGWAAGDYLVPALATGYAARRIIDVRTVAAADPISLTAGGRTSGGGHWLTRQNADWSSVQAGDLVVIRRPITIEGIYRVDMVASEGLYFQRPLANNQRSIQYSVIRRSYAEVEEPLPQPADLSFAVVRPSQAWRYDMWKGGYLFDRHGRQHAIEANDASSLRLAHPLEPGPIIVRGSFADAEANEENLEVLDQSSAVVAPGDYVRRFEPVLDGVRLTDWLTDTRRTNLHRPILPLLAAGADTADVRVGNTVGITVGDRYTLQAVGQPTLDVAVAAIPASGTLRLDQDVAAAYTPARMARLVPRPPDAIGASGFYVVRAGREAANTSSDGLRLTDSGADFTRGVEVGDTVRYVSPTGVATTALVSLADATTLTLVTALPANVQGGYYEIVRFYDAARFARLSVDVVPYLPDLYDRAATERVIEALKPSHVNHLLSDSALARLQFVDTQYDRGSIIIDGLAHERIFDWIRTIDNTSFVDGDDLVDDTFIVGPQTDVWGAEEFFYATYNRGIQRSSHRYFSRASGDTAPIDPRSADGSLAMTLGRFRIHNDRSRLVFDRTGTGNTLSMKTWQHGDGHELSFFFRYGEDLFELRVEAAAATASTLTWQGPVPAALLAATSVVVTLTSKGGLGRYAGRLVTH